MSDNRYVQVGKHAANSCAGWVNNYDEWVTQSALRKVLTNQVLMCVGCVQQFHATSFDPTAAGILDNQGCKILKLGSQ